ncbi:MAG: TlyA family RNA methyltransferase [Leptospiraceae bacterium]|nr:TlyA family RNA methyltransferase [Leptospiraceae bacterium]
MSKEKIRLDQLLIDLGLADSLRSAEALILSGKVLVEDRVITKKGNAFSPNSRIRIRTKKSNFASRGGDKLNPILDNFNLSITGKICLDLGASTGGFTDVLLRRGAEKVYAIDVGYGLLEGSLRNHTRVIVMDRFHVKDLTWESLSLRPCNLFVVMDLSFISLRSILPVFYDLKQKSEGIQLEFLSLCKPQFELEESYLEKGVVRKNTDRFLALVRVSRAIKKNLGGEILGIKESPLSGAKGNREIFIYWKL